MVALSLSRKKAVHQEKIDAEESYSVADEPDSPETLDTLYGKASDISWTGPWDQCIGFTPDDCCAWLKASVTTIEECETKDIEKDLYVDMQYVDVRVRIWMNPQTGVVVAHNGGGPRIG
eukprot:CAMPEP_0116828632 /NCGR_PEP_ID=MMETSP0418-20121206/3756_1 /TAXON_ID=1158023 /ORGANISM="Astrosyne radiata, Strain 13vi08-1A" /LENGTH=118 /DNA_ID=CAMNT_0004457527 /DNA_START=249 /DNA_END=606 /DNA_ORIENTATION=+